MTSSDELIEQIKAVIAGRQEVYLSTSLPNDPAPDLVLQVDALIALLEGLPIPDPPPDEEETWTGETTVNLNVRATPDTTRKAIGILQKGTAVVVSGNGAWLKLIKPMIGYVSATYVEKL